MAEKNFLLDTQDQLYEALSINNFLFNVLSDKPVGFEMDGTALNGLLINLVNLEDRIKKAKNLIESARR